MKFEITKDKKGHRFVLLDGNDQPIMTSSRHYTRARDAERAIERIQERAMFAPVEAA